MTRGITARLARRSAARPWLAIAVWAVALVLAGAASTRLGDALTQDDRNLVTTESDTARELVDTIMATQSPDALEPATELVVVTSEDATYGSASFDAALDAAAAALDGVDGIATVADPDAAASSPGTIPVSEDGRTALLTATVVEDAPEEIGGEINAALAEAEPDGFRLLPYGEASAGATFDGLAEDTLVRGEAIGIGVALVILVVVFGAVVAAGLPLMVALVSIVAAVGATAVVGQAFELSFFIVNMITMMGLALGIDYSLVIVQRFREELARGRTVVDAVGVAGSTASRAVLFSGITVLISLFGLLLVPHTIMRSLGAGAIIVAIMSVVTALTLLPAVLRLLGHRVNKGRIPTAHPGRESRVWRGIARTVTARPAVAAGAGLAILAALAVPFASIRLAFPGAEALPEDNEFRMAEEALVDDFGYGRSETLVVMPDAAGDRGAVTSLASAVEADPAFVEVDLGWYGDDAILTMEDVYDSADQRAEAAVERLRDTTVPRELAGTGVEAYVGGNQAESIDFNGIIEDAVPWVLLVVLGSSFLLLTIIFRSVVIAGTAIALNVLSAAAAFGVMVAVFEWGWGADLLGMPQVDGIAPWLPLFLFAVLFGLSMDYHVFLLSRIKEAHDSGISTRDAIVTGLSRTGSLITGAALIMVAVFSGFALGDLAEFAQMGLGLAVAVILDATIVRSLLVPSVMTLLGRANWYLPSWLGWLPQMRIEVEEPEAEPALVPARVTA